jgi:hypothetical protein
MNELKAPGDPSRAAFGGLLRMTVEFNGERHPEVRAKRASKDVVNDLWIGMDGEEE